MLCDLTLWDLVKTVNLDSAGNSRLLHMLERKLGWGFSVTQFLGKKNRISDALSRYRFTELAALAVLVEEFPTKEEMQEAEKLEGAVLASTLGLILS